jgi:hypothetical protein
LPALADLVNLIQYEVRRHLEGRQERISVAAFLFAACRYLARGEDRSWQITYFRPAASKKGRALNALLELPPGASAEELNAAFGAALADIDNSFAQADAAISYPASTALVSPGQPSHPLQGRIFHWVREASCLRQAREEGAGPQTFEERLSRSLRYLILHHSENGDEQIASVLRDAYPFRPMLTSATANRGRGFRIALCPLPGSWHPCFELVDGSTPRMPAGSLPPGFRILEESPIHALAQLEEFLELVLRDADALGVKILVFPELSISEPLRRRLAQGLQRGRNVQAVFAGSFHVRIGQHHQNEAVVLDGRKGEIFWRHEKSGKFKIMRDQLSQVQPFFPRHPLPSADMIVEAVRSGSQLRFLSTPLGLLAMLICSDALDEAAMDRLDYLPLINAVHPDLVVVVAMSPKTGPFVDFLERMKKMGTGVLLVNAACVCRAAPGRALPDLALVDLRLPEVGGLRTRWRWRVDGALEWFDWRAEVWQPASGQDGGVHPAAGGWGLVIDLGFFLERLSEEKPKQ